LRNDRLPRAEESLIETWDQRVTVDEQPFTHHERGVPIEYMFAFSNLINANMYVNVPMKSADSYHQNMATYVNNHLNKHLKVYLEYGNEIFNPVTPLPNGYAIQQGETLSGINSGDSDFVKAGSYAGYRSAQIFDIWRTQLGTDASRFVGVIVGFNPIQAFTLAALDYGNAFEKADALAINGYIGPSRPYVSDKNAFDSLTVETLLTEIADGSILDSGSSILDLNQIYVDHVSIASARNLDLIA